MKFLLVTALFGIGIFVGVCNAACYNTAPHLHIGRDPGGCIEKGEIHEYGSTWGKEKCMDCDCSYDGSIHCCTIGGYAVNYDKEKCKEIFNKETCLTDVVRKDDPNQRCPHGMVG
ncbi:beta-microseminoprotein-like [Leptodactylus fuscus]|uniref:beta-microseminoprotein-like n=1 Tax=Leptodactylus fuscus TaxID=238119 RepID=UPI003F4EF1AD